MDDFLTAHVWSGIHWPFVAWAIIASVIGQVMKTSVWTRKRAHTKGRFQWFWWWGCKTLPLHPIASGVLLGLVWANPEVGDPAWVWPTASVYFATAGALSISLYEVVKGLARKRGVHLGPLPGESKTSPKPKP